MITSAAAAAVVEAARKLDDVSNQLHEANKTLRKLIHQKADAEKELQVALENLKKASTGGNP